MKLHSIQIYPNGQLGWVWHNIPVGPFGRHPDFVALHPQQGIVVLEVKDWRLDTIVNANSRQVELMTARGRVQFGRVGTVPTLGFI